MDINNNNFMFNLIPMLDNISRAELVSFDLEMSGIGARTKFGRSDRVRDVDKPSLQQQYEETRNAAIKYQVLQLGLTCVSWDKKNERYVARPYNINVSPLFDDMRDNLGLDRQFTFSSSASHFLIKNNFDLSKPFTSGVSYLSMAEEREAYEIYASRNAKSEIPDLVIEPGTPALEFYRQARGAIGKWINKPGGYEYCNIPQTQEGADGLTGFERRLVYQLVRKEFPEYQAFSMDGGRFMQIKKFDSVRESQFQKDRRTRFDAMVARQIGLRFIFEALTGGDLARINTNWCLVDETGKSKFTDKEALDKRLHEIRGRLKGKKRFLVGHNLFTDLLFFYQTFVGDLPLDVDEFRRKVHGFFPLVADTKYLATFRGGLRNNSSSLVEIWDMLKNQTTPALVVDPEFTKYSTGQMYHEAGYDSWITAEILVKLSSKLFATNVHLDSEKSAPTVIEKSSIDNLPYPVISPLDQPATNGTSVKPPRKLAKFASPGRFDQLIDEGDSDSDSSASTSSGDNGVSIWESTQSLKNRPASINLMDADIDENFRSITKNAGNGIILETNSPSKSVVAQTVQNQQAKQKKFPRFEDPFWKVFGNSLRVFGIEDDVMYLGERPSTEDEN